MNRPRGIRRLKILGAAVIALLATISVAEAGDPEYLRLRARVGIGIEAKGDYDADTGFTVDEIVRLPSPRSPKLRGALLAVAEDGSTVTMFGIEIAITKRTEFENGSASDLKPGIRAEISCSISDETGAWRARSVKLRDVKSSDKIKGTVTEVDVDGEAPDSVSISGLRLILVESTDFEEASREVTPAEKMHFGKLADPSRIRGSYQHRSGTHTSIVALEYRQDLRSTDDFDLSSQFDSDTDTTQPELRGSWYGFWNSRIRGQLQARARQRLLLNSPAGLEEPELELQLMQAFVQLQGIWNDRLALKIGRQNFEDPREWLYDDYLDAARAIVFARPDLTLELAYIDAINPLKSKIETWRDALVKVDWWSNEDNQFSAYWLRRWDSDEIREREPIWWGVRAMGEARRGVEYWMDAALMRGSDKQRSLEAWAVDLGATWRFLDLGLQPAVTLSYAIGTGDETGGDQVDGEFRQTGYDDNTVRLGGRNSAYMYGAVLDPELSNIGVLTLALAIRPTPGSSIELIYHSYEQRWAADELRSDLIAPPAIPNGQSTDLGWGADLLIGLPRVFERVRASITLGSFHPGDAFAPRQENAYMAKINLSVGIG